MINSILIGKLVYEKLSTDSALHSYVNGRIFPLIAEMGTAFPYIAFSKDSISPAYTKDGCYEDQVSVQIVVASVDYLQSLDIANVVRGIFEGKRYKSEELSISECRMTNVSEAYDDNAGVFIQRLFFNFKVL